jgi:hypothetical protein
MKNHRFGWSFRDARCHDPQRIRLLLLMASLALATMTLIGLAAEAKGLHWQYQANTVRNRRMISTFFLGSLILKRAQFSTLLAAELLEQLQEIHMALSALSPEITDEPPL